MAAAIADNDEHDVALLGRGERLRGVRRLETKRAALLHMCCKEPESIVETPCKTRRILAPAGFETTEVGIADALRDAPSCSNVTIIGLLGHVDLRGAVPTMLADSWLALWCLQLLR